jgi:hypothetical protein
LRPRAEIGSAFATGDPGTDAAGGAQLAWQAVVLAEAGVRVALFAGLHAELGAVFGAAHGLVVRADDRALATTHGLLVGASLGISRAF